MDPTPSRPELPRGYGIEKATGAPGERLPWSEVGGRLTAARNYDWPLSPEDLDPANPDAAFYAVRPSVALSWGTATEIGETITRWSFG